MPHVALSGTSALVVSHAVSGLVRAIAHEVVVVRGLIGAPPPRFRRFTTWARGHPVQCPRLIRQSIQDLSAASIEISEAVCSSTLAEWRQAPTIMTTSEEDGEVPAEEVTSRRSVRTTTPLSRAHLRRLGALADDQHAELTRPQHKGGICPRGPTAGSLSSSLREPRCTTCIPTGRRTPSRVPWGEGPRRSDVLCRHPRPAASDRTL